MEIFQVLPTFQNGLEMSEIILKGHKKQLKKNKHTHKKNRLSLKEIVSLRLFYKSL